MIERAIENWLTNTNERNYQTPFCQALMIQGHTVLYSSRHGPMEQGKDIVTIDDSGQVHAYQLKTGKITLASWRSIKGEIAELVELPFDHPSVSKCDNHISYLVCNGEVIDEVRDQIDKRNEDNKRRNRHYSYLNVIAIHQLLEYFVDAQRGFLPSSLEDFDAFLKLRLSNGRDFIDKEALSHFLTGSVLKPNAKRASDRIHGVSSSVVLLGYLLKPYQEAENHFALFEAWGLLAAAIVNYAESHGIQREWQQSFHLAFDEAIENLRRLKEETLCRTYFLEGDPMGDGGFMYRGRLATVLGAIAFLELHLVSEGTSDQPDERVVDLIVSNIDRLWLWGDSAIPFLLNMIWILEQAGRIDETEELLDYALRSTLISNTSAGDYIEEESPLASPYYTLSAVLETIFGFADDPIDFGAFTLSSHSLEVLTEVIARRELRHLLEPNWRKATHVLINGFIPDQVEDYLSWRVAVGKNESYFLQPTQSWASLVEESRQRRSDFLLGNQEILRMWTLIAPHRLTKETAAIVDPHLD